MAQSTPSPTVAVVPRWIMMMAFGVQVTALILLILYLMGKMQCDKYVHTVIWITLAWWLFTLAWFFGTGADMTAVTSS